MKSYKPVTSAVRVLEVLSGVAHFSGAATVGDLHRKTGIDKATVVRMLATLIQSGFVVRDSENATYAITGKTLLLSESYDRLRVFANTVTPIFEKLRDEIGWPAEIDVLDQTEMMRIAGSHDYNHPISFKKEPRQRTPVLASATGLAYIAHCCPQEREEFLTMACAQQLDWCDMACEPEMLDPVFADIREKGYACACPKFMEQNYSVEVASIGVPIQSNGHTFGAISATYLPQFVTMEQIENDLQPPLRTLSQKMGQALSQIQE